MAANRYFDPEFWKRSLLSVATSQTTAAALKFADKAVEELGKRLPLDSSMRVRVADGDVSVGDRAQVLRYEEPVNGAEPSPLDQGWVGPWTTQHELSVAGMFQVIGIYLPGNGVVLSNGLSYPPSCLVAV